MHDETQKLNNLATGIATAFAIAVLAVYPLYIDKFSNLGLVKYTGVATLILLACFAVAACAAIGARTMAGRFASGQDWPAITLFAFCAATLISTGASLVPVASLWGLGSYYGGLSLVLLTAAGYLCVRCFFAPKDFGFLCVCVSITVTAVTILYLLNILNIDLIGSYADTAVVERAQFFSTLGQKDFNAGYLSIALPICFYFFLESDGRKPTALRALPAVFGALALVIVDSDGLLLGIGTALLLLVCHRDFTTRQLRRIAFLGACFFGWDGLMFWFRSHHYTQGGTPMLAKFGEPARAIPGALLCVGIWLLLWLLRRGKTELPLYKVGRALAAIGVAGVLLLLALANFGPGLPALGGLNNFLVFNDDWGTYRGTAWRIAWCSWAQGGPLRWVVGFGPGMMHNAVAHWAGADITSRMKTFYAAHNEYLEQLLTTGLLGLAAWLAFVWVHLRRGLRAWGRPGVAAVVLALCSYLAQATVSIRVSMIFPEVMLLFALLAVFTAPEKAQTAQPAVRIKGKVNSLRVPPAEPPEAKAKHYAKLAVAAAGMMVAAAVVSPVVFAFLYA